MGIMGIIGMIIVGFIVGVLARFFYPGAVNMGFWMTTLLGIGGSLVGGVIASIVWKYPDGRFRRRGLVPVDHWRDSSDLDLSQFPQVRK